MASRLTRPLKMGPGIATGCGGPVTQPADRLSYPAIKYGSRDSWAQRDLLRLAHPRVVSGQHGAILH